MRRCRAYKGFGSITATGCPLCLSVIRRLPLFHSDGLFVRVVQPIIANEHGSQNAIVSENPPPMLGGEFANNVFAFFVGDRAPNPLQLLRAHETLLLSCQR